MKLGKLYPVVCYISLCIGISLSGKPYRHAQSRYVLVFVMEDDLELLFAVELQPSNSFVEVCLGNTVEVNCTTETDHLLWSTSPVAECRVLYNKQSTSVGVVMAACNFEAVLLSTSPSLTSTATLTNVTLSHNGTVLTCANTIVQVNLGPDQMASIYKHSCYLLCCSWCVITFTTF